jgi:hypothetical protein
MSFVSVAAAACGLLCTGHNAWTSDIVKQGSNCQQGRRDGA